MDRTDCRYRGYDVIGHCVQTVTMISYFVNSSPLVYNDNQRVIFAMKRNTRNRTRGNSVQKLPYELL
jgi:hypothetical protein